MDRFCILFFVIVIVLVIIISAMFVMYIGSVDLVDVGRWCSWVLPERYKTKLLISDFMVWRSSSHFKVGNPTGILFSIESRTGNLIGILFSIESRIGNSIGVLFLIESRIVRTRLISQINLTNLKDTNTWWSTLQFEQEIFLIIEWSVQAPLLLVSWWFLQFASLMGDQGRWISIPPRILKIFLKWMKNVSVRFDRVAWSWVPRTIFLD